MKTKLVFKNVFVSGWTRLVIMVLGIIMPRLMITSFGSEVNGLLSTVAQIFTYLSLLEAGIGTSTINALYSPLTHKNRGQVNEVATEAQRYYRKVSLLYGACILAFSIVYPFLAQTELSKLLVFKIIILQGASSFLNYYFCAVYDQLLIADGRKYVLENIHFISYILNTAGKILLIYMGFDVVAVQLIGLLLTIIKIPILKTYVHKKYPWLNRQTQPTKHYLKERKAFVIHEFSTVIFHNTDVFILSTFCGFAMASVYTVYNMIYAALNNLLNTANAGLGFVFGQNLDKGKAELRRIYDMYNSLYNAVLFIVFTVAALMTKPFLTLYISGVTDANYLMPGLALLFVVTNLLSGVRAIGSRLITVSGHAENTKVRSIVEATINLVASLVLVYFLDIYGVLLGTTIALLYRANDIIIYANRKILERSPLRNYVNVLINGLVFALIYWLVGLWNPPMPSYVHLFAYALLFVIASTLVYVSIAFVTNVSAFKPYLGVIKQKLRKPS